MNDFFAGHDTGFYISILIFATIYIGIIFEVIPRTLCALIGGGLMIYMGFETQESAIKEFIDFNTIGLLTGMMMIIEIVKKSGFFELLALWAVKKSRGDGFKLLLLLAVITGFGAAVIDSVTAALLIAPMTISVCRMLRLTPIPIIIAEILMANIGGTALMIGNPPNVMIGSAAHLEFMTVANNLAPAVVVTMIITLGIVLWFYRADLSSEGLSDEEIESINIKEAIKDEMILKRSLSVLLLTVVGFVVHSHFGIESATVALTGGVLAVLVCKVEPEEIMKEVDFSTLFFFMGLFVMVGGLESTGVIHALATWGVEQVQGDTVAMTFLILWLSGVASAFVDNIPFTATMIPLIQNMQDMLNLHHADYMWWALALGACFGGNGTIIGASPNVIMLAIAAKEGYNVSFGRFFKLCFPIMLITLLISSVYIYLRYFVFMV